MRISKRCIEDISQTFQKQTLCNSSRFFKFSNLWLERWHKMTKMQNPDAGTHIGCSLCSHMKQILGWESSQPNVTIISPHGDFDRAGPALSHWPAPAWVTNRQKFTTPRQRTSEHVSVKISPWKMWRYLPESIQLWKTLLIIHNWLFAYCFHGGST